MYIVFNSTCTMSATQMVPLRELLFPPSIDVVFVCNVPHGLLMLYCTCDPFIYMHVVGNHGNSVS